MPDDLTLVPNPNWLTAEKRTTEEIAWFKSLRPVQCPPSVARDNLRLSNGLYMQEVAEAVPTTTAPANLADMSAAQLKVMAAQLGLKLEGKLPKSRVIELIQAELDKSEIEDDAAA